MSSARQQTCLVCRDRKVRCDREEPKCGRCVRLRLPCGYKQPTTHPDDLPKQLAELQGRLAKAEALLASSSSSSYSYASSSTIPAPPRLQSILPKDTITNPSNPAPPIPVVTSNGTQQPNATTTYQEFEALDFSIPVEDELLHDMDWALDWDMPNFVSEDARQTPAANLAAAATPIPLFGEVDMMTEDELAPLHAKYFDLVHATYPFVSRRRFASEEAVGPCPLPKQALKYAVALMGSTASPLHAHLCRPCYRLARKYMELCEQSDQEADLINLNTFQALLLVIRYEIMGKSLKKAWMTLGRAIRLSKMMQLEIFDTDRIARQSEALNFRLNAQEADEAEEKGDTDTSEEWRKSFWALYMLESYASTRTGMACELGDASDFVVFLPKPDATDQIASSDEQVLFRDWQRQYSNGTEPLSSYSGCILMVELAIQCFDHVRRAQSASAYRGFWDVHYSLIKEMKSRRTALRRHLDPASVRGDPLAFSMHMNLCATEICFHDAAISQIRGQGLPDELAAESRKSSSAAAFRVAAAVSMTWPVGDEKTDFLALQATFVAWPLVMAIQTMKRDIDTTPRDTDVFHNLTKSLGLLAAALSRVEQPGWYWHGKADMNRGSAESDMTGSPNRQITSDTGI